MAVTHGLLLGDARQHLEARPIREVIITDTVPASGRWALGRVVSVAPLIAGAIRQFMVDGSLDALS